MRLIHTADWHLGRLFHNVHLTRDQEHVLEQLVELARDVRPDAVIVAGDLYDRAVPPTEAVDLLDHVLTELVDGLGVPVVAIAGNHDSAVRVGFASTLLRERGLHLVGELPQAASPIVLRDEHGPVRICALPFADPAEARHVYGDEAIHDQQAVAAAGVRQALAATAPDERRVLVAHAFVAGGLESESERPLSVGGAQQVPAGMLAGFDYVALGHLHRPQTCGSETTRYAGSLLKYSFAEAAHDKSVCVVEIGPRGSAPGEAGRAGRAAVAVETVALSPRRDVRRLEGTLAELLARGPPTRTATTTSWPRSPTAAPSSTPSAGCAPRIPTRSPSSARPTSAPAPRDGTGRVPGRSATSTSSRRSSATSPTTSSGTRAASALTSVLDGLERARREARA